MFALDSRVPTLSVGESPLLSPHLPPEHTLHTNSWPGSALGQILVHKGTSSSVILLWTAVVTAQTSLFGVFMGAGLLIGWCFSFILTRVHFTPFTACIFSWIQPAVKKKRILQNAWKKSIKGIHLAVFSYIWSLFYIQICIIDNHLSSSLIRTTKLENKIENVLKIILSRHNQAQSFYGL